MILTNMTLTTTQAPLPQHFTELKPEFGNLSKPVFLKVLSVNIEYSAMCHVRVIALSS